jgi:hypothetical protein
MSIIDYSHKEIKMNIKKLTIPFLVILTFFFGFFGYFRVSAATITDQDQSNKIKETINSYFELRYEALKTLSLADFSNLSTSPENSVTSEWLQREQDRQDVELFIAETFNNHIVEYKFFLDYQNIEIKETKAVVTLLENNEVYYSSTPTIASMMANVKHTITFAKVNGSWKILDDQYHDDMIELVSALGKENVFNNIQYNHDSQYLPPVLDGQIEDESPAATYNGVAAANYADTWATGRNPFYHDEGDYDCTNFASQGIYEGTNHTMSSPTNYMTKWYFDDFTPHTGSFPWIRVEGIYTFLTTNTGRGPYGYNSGSYLCNLGKGHVVLMKQAGVWKHTVIVSKIIGDCHDPSKILVDAHSDNYYRRALSKYSGYTWYAITISGYRTVYP